MFKKAVVRTRPPIACVNMRLPRLYVEPLSDARTPLADFFNLLLAAFHGLVQRITVGDLDEVSTALKGRQRRKGVPALMSAKQRPQRALNQLGHRPPLFGGFSFELRHVGGINIQGCLHMVNHTRHMAVCQALPFIG